MPKVFICYRREDSAYPVHEIFRKLKKHFGSKSVVLDIDTIPPGEDFREYVNNQINMCDILLAVIGDRWIETLWQRLDDPEDFVRFEIKAALEKDVPVVPILLGKTLMPSEENLPPELAGLAYRQAAEVRTGPDLEDQLKRLIDLLDRLLGHTHWLIYLKFGTLIALGLFFFVGGIWYYLQRPSHIVPHPSTTKEPKRKDTQLTQQAMRTELDEIRHQISNLGEKIEKVKTSQDLKEIYEQKDEINRQIEILEKKAAKIEMVLETEEVQRLLDDLQIQLTANEKSLAKPRTHDPSDYLVEMSVEGYESERRRIDRRAEQQGPLRISIINSIGMKFMLIPAGKFDMGSQLSAEEIVEKYGGAAFFYRREHPRHPVDIKKPFYIQTTEVTQGQWKQVMGEIENRFYFKECGDDCPVEGVSWLEIQKFIKKLNEMEALVQYRLPTEAEWEYACRAKTVTEFSFGDDASRLGEYAWYSENSKYKTHPAATRKPNPWGLYDMHGNVMEWVEDCWHGNYEKSPEDGSAWLEANNGDCGWRVVRGGCLLDEPWTARSASRTGGHPVPRNFNMGFRLARAL